MSDPLSVTASAAGLVSLGLTVCSGLLEYYSAWRDQPSNVSAMCESLVALNRTFELLDEKIRHPLLDRKSVDRVNESIISCAAAIQGLRSKLDKIRNAKTGMGARIQRAQYPFRQKTLEKLLRAISDLRGNLSLATSTLQLDVSITSFHQLNQLDTDIKKVIVGQEEEKLRTMSGEERNVINWLSPLEFSSKQNDALSRRQEGTGQWLLKSTEFCSWIDTPGTVLWCPGMPGAGKTILASTVIDHLEQEHRREKIGVAYVFCVHNDANQTAGDFLGSLLQQLAMQSFATLDDIKSCHEHHTRYRTRPSFNEISRLLRSQVESFDEVFIVIDALDECSEVGQIRRSFLAEVRGLLPKISLMVTSRQLLSIESMFKDDNRLEIRAQEQDVQSFIESQMDQRFELVDLLEGHDDVRSSITATVLDRTNGMFLIAALHMDSLAKEDNIRDLKESLQRLPEALDKTYDDALERIKSQDSRKLARADQVLTLINCAKRPLKLEQMRQALSIRRGDTFLDPEALPKTESLSSTCCGLVVVEDESQIVRLVHYTTEEYFKRRLPRYSSPEAHRYFAGILITYLNFTEFKIRSLDKTIKDAIKFKSCYSTDAYWLAYHAVNDCMENFVSNNVLMTYAAENWGRHASEAFADIEYDSKPCLATTDFKKSEANNLWNLKQLIPDLPQKEHNVACANEVLHYVEKTLNDFRSDFNLRGPTEVTNLHVAASFGIQYFVEYYLKQGADIDASDSEGMTALHKASKYGHVGIVQFLLNSGAAIALQDRVGRDALVFAVCSNEVSVSRLLLQNGSDPSSLSRSGNGRTLPTIKIAILQGNEELSQLLAEYETDELKRSSLMRDIFVDAASHGRDDVVHYFLIGGGKKWNISERDLEEAIHIAAVLNYVTIMEILLETGVYTGSSSRLGMTLHEAVYKGHVGIVALLLEKGADFDALDSEGNTAIVVLAKQIRWSKNTVSIIQQLLEKGADVAATDSEFNQTALEWAVLRGNEDSVQLLLQYESFSAPRQNLMLSLTRFYRAIEVDQLYRAIEEENDEAVDRLLREKEVRELGNLSKLLLIFIPAERGYEGVVRTFRKLGAALNAENAWGKTALHLAAERGHLAVVKFLLDEAADVNAKDPKGATPLMMAADKGWTNVIEHLLKYGADIDAISADNSIGGCSALRRAFDGGHKATEKVLLEKGADPNSRYYQETLLHAMVRKPITFDRSRLDLLLEKGADLEAKDIDGQTPLVVAVSKSKCGFNSLQTVQYLLERGANQEARDSKGQTALVVAVRIGNPIAVQCLLKRGANLEARDNDGQTALVVAVRRGNLEAVQLLLKRGANSKELSPAVTVAGSWVRTAAFHRAIKLVLDAQSKTK